VTSKADEQRERRALAGSTNTTTYHQRAQVELGLDDAAGRFGKPSVLTGSEPTVRYPRPPASSPWASDPVPPEEPLGLDVNALEAVGTAAEIEASLAALEAPMADHSAAVVKTSAAIPTRRKLK
jgi:hypothetical protein